MTSRNSGIRFSTFPRTEPPPRFTNDIVSVFKSHESEIGTLGLEKGLTSDMVLSELRDDLTGLGFEVEGGKRRAEKIERPVFYGENGIPTLKNQVDAYDAEWECGLEIEAGRGWTGNAVYRDLIQACVMVQVKYLILVVSNAYKYMNSGRPSTSQDYDNAVALANALYKVDPISWTGLERN